MTRSRTPAPTPPAPAEGSACTDCGTTDTPHLGELATTRVAIGVVRDERVRRCTPCHKQHLGYQAEQLPIDGRGRVHWGIRNLRTDELVRDSNDQPQEFTMLVSAEAYIRGLREIDSLKPS